MAMAAGYGTTTEELQRAAQQVAQVNEQVQAQLAALRNQLAPLAGAWRGEASTAFQGLMARWDSDARTLQNLAWVLRGTLRRLDQALENPPYNFIIHTAPLQEGNMPAYHWHIEIMPKLTRVAGFEWATGFHINPTPPEEAAKFLREMGIA